MKEFYPKDPFFFYKVQNGFILQESPANSSCARDEQFVFRDVNELCNWIIKYYDDQDLNK